MIRSRAILDHARGQPCQLALAGFCCRDPQTTVFAHLNGHAFGKGAGVKAHDIAGFFACHLCHAAYDLHQYTITSDELLRAVIGTWVILVTDGIIKVPLDKPKEHKPKARKPQASRVRIPNNGRPMPSRPFPKRGKS